MHDVSRDSFLRKQWDEKKRRSHQHPHNDHESGHHHSHQERECAEGHSHSHSLDILHSDDERHVHHHDHDGGHGTHHHEEGDDHHHRFLHAHDHRHVFYHSHGHQHDRVRSTLVHRVLKDPARDWFGVGLVCCCILLGISGIAPPLASKGLFLAAAVIGLFPAVKNAVLTACIEKKISVELFAALLILLLVGSGYFREAALAALFLLLGSFLRLDFSWGEH